LNMLLIAKKRRSKKMKKKKEKKEIKKLHNLQRLQFWIFLCSCPLHTSLFAQLAQPDPLLLLTQPPGGLS
jgi:hypothetical protein